MRLSNFVIAAALLCLTCQPAPAQAGNQRQAAPKINVDAIRRGAEQGNAIDQAAFGAMYDSGHGISQDYTQAAVWYRKAAEQGDALAQFELGWLYGTGHGVLQDYAQAVIWLRKAAEQGVADAQSQLGDEYTKGHGVPQNYVQAAIWYRKAAEQGNASAQARLGAAYDLGDGVPRNYAEAYFWLDLAASGKVNLTGIKQEDTDNLRDETAKRLTPAELSQVQERAKKWFEAHPVKIDSQ
jgi:TPR repeat protein